VVVEDGRDDEEGGRGGRSGRADYAGGLLHGGGGEEWLEAVLEVEVLVGGIDLNVGRELMGVGEGEAQREAGRQLGGRKGWGKCRGQRGLETRQQCLRTVKEYWEERARNKGTKELNMDSRTESMQQWTANRACSIYTQTLLAPTPLSSSASPPLPALPLPPLHHQATTHTISPQSSSSSFVA